MAQNTRYHELAVAPTQRFYGIEFDQICLYAESNHDGTCTNGWWDTYSPIVYCRVFDTSTALRIIESWLSVTSSEYSEELNGSTEMINVLWAPELRIVDRDVGCYCAFSDTSIWHCGVVQAVLSEKFWVAFSSTLFQSDHWDGWNLVMFERLRRGPGQPTTGLKLHWLQW